MALVLPNFNEPCFVMFPEIKKRVTAGLCAECERLIVEEDFRSEHSKSEYSISGLCQFCQDQIFTQPL